MDFNKRALDYHREPKPGKITVNPSKPLNTQQELSLAYSPGVAQPCLKIKEDPSASFDYTTRGNLVGVLSNGSAVLGLGNIGAYAAKPVMEGKAMLFKKFAGIDVFDLEIAEQDPDAAKNRQIYGLPLVASIWKTSKPLNASTSNKNYKKKCPYRFSTTINTELPS